jgi:hypothetical protein
MTPKLDRSILLKLTPAEKLEWQEKAARAGLPLTVMIRQVMRGARLSSRIDRAFHAERTYQIRRIGINLNQIARWANTYKLSAEAIEVIESLRAIEKALKELSATPEKGEGDDAR